MSVNMQSTSTARIVLYFLRRHLREFLVLAGLAVVVGALEGFNLAVFIPMLNNLVGLDPSATGSAYKDRTLVNAIYGLVEWIPLKDPFVSAGVLFLMITVVKGVLALGHEYLSAKTTGRLLHQYRVLLLERYRTTPLAKFDDSRVGALVYDLTQPPIMLTRLLYAVPRLLVDLMRFIFILALFLYIEPVITAGVAGVAMIAYLTFSRRLSIYLYHLGVLRRRVEQQMASISTEWLKGVRQIRIGGADGHWIDAFKSNSELARGSYVRSSLLLASPRHVFEMVGFSAMLIGMIWSYSADPQSFRQSLAMISFLALGLIRVLPSVAALARAPLDIRSTMPDVEHLYRQLHETGQQESSGDCTYAGLKDSIAINNLRASYPGRGVVIDGLSLRIPRSSVVAFVGKSGSGKSTLLNLLLGIHRPDSGSVTFDDAAVEMIDRKSLLAHTGYVCQDVVLFYGSVAENIAYFDASIPLARIKWAAKLAQIDEFIESLPNGYDTRVGEGGANLSGGQAQRIAIARALINDPDLLILDEPTSSLDSTAEGAVLAALQHAAEHRTVVLVTHRLLSAKWADEIFVMDQGKIVQQGNFDTLANDPSGPFSGMLREQHPS